MRCLTGRRAVDTMRFFEEAIEFSHFLDRFPAPSFRFHNRRNLPSQRLNIRGVCCQVEYDIRQELVVYIKFSKNRIKLVTRPLTVEVVRMEETSRKIIRITMS